MGSHSPSAAALLERLVPGLFPLTAPLAAAIEHQALVFEREGGTVLFEDGQACPGLLMLERGVVRVSLTTESGRSLLLYRLLPGETCVLTLSCLLGQERYPARGEVESDARGVSLPQELFDRLLLEAPAFRRHVFRAFGERLRGALAMLSSMAFEPLDQRLATLLLDHAGHRNGTDLAVTHQQLADELGCTREAASRLLENLASLGAVELGRGHVRLQDKEALARLAHPAR